MYNEANRMKPEIRQDLKPGEILREDGVRIEKICKHGVGHPVAATRTWENWMSVHGCDGCCFKAEFWLEVLKDENL